LLNCDVGDVVEHVKNTDWPRKGVPIFVNKNELV
jgi:hypothetical protein